ncbi:MAG: transcription repressor NadR [Bacillota bacterium]
MKAEARREAILNLLSTKETPVTGSKLATKFEVSRQVIVQDIALLRAEGKEIVATSQGYIMPEERSSQFVSRTLACQHDGTEIADELELIIKHGGRVKDVIVEHPIYGELKGLLMIQSTTELESFVAKTEQEEVKPLLTLTEGVHLHTIEALNEEVLDSIETALQEADYLLEDY